MMLLPRIQSHPLISPSLLICSNVFAVLATLAHCCSKTTRVQCCKIFDHFKIENYHQKAIHVHFSKCCFVFLMGNFKKIRNIFNKIFAFL